MESLWLPIVGIWFVGMVVTMMVERSRDLVHWASIAADLAVFALLTVAVLSGTVVIGERAEQLLGMPTDWVWLMWCVVILRSFMGLKSSHERGKGLAGAAARQADHPENLTPK